jgi:hypothetical protein
VNVADVAFVGFAGEEVIVGVGGPLFARAVHAAQPLSARTPSSARGIHALALFAVVVRWLIMVVDLGFLFSRGEGGINGRAGGRRSSRPFALPIEY